MFNLEQSISEWRQQMLAAGIKPESLDELESHLREDIELQTRAGFSTQFAFDTAVAQIGRPATLKKEFTRAGEARWAVVEKFKTILGFKQISFPPQADFSPEARLTLGFAAAEARGFNHNFIGTEHILLGLIKSESGIVSKVLRRLGVEDKALRTGIEIFVGKSPAHEIPAKIPYTPRAKNAMRFAAREAQTSNRSRINPEDIFLGLILEGDGVAWRALKNLGIQIENARSELLAEMREHPGTA
jgi:hypothetical protein